LAVGWVASSEVDVEVEVGGWRGKGKGKGGREVEMWCWGDRRNIDARLLEDWNTGILERWGGLRNYLIFSYK
jgi:hypothetical protein